MIINNSGLLFWATLYIFVLTTCARLWCWTFESTRFLSTCSDRSVFRRCLSTTECCYGRWQRQWSAGV